MTDQKKDGPLVARIAPRLKRLEGAAQVKFGTVATVAPLTVYLDGDLDDNENPIATPAHSMTGTLTAGQLVACVEQDRRVTVITAQS